MFDSIHPVILTQLQRPKLARSCRPKIFRRVTALRVGVRGGTDAVEFHSFIGLINKAFGYGLPNEGITILMDKKHTMI